MDDNDYSSSEISVYYTLCRAHAEGVKSEDMKSCPQWQASLSPDIFRWILHHNLYVDDVTSSISVNFSYLCSKDLSGL